MTRPSKERTSLLWAEKGAFMKSSSCRSSKILSTLKTVAPVSEQHSSPSSKSSAKRPIEINQSLCPYVTPASRI